MSMQRKKGTQFETDVADYLRTVLGDDRIERRAQSGTKDRGDIAGFTIRGKRTVLECKNHRRLELYAWVDEAEAERGNDGADFGVVIVKRPGKGRSGIGESYAVMTLETLAAIAAGSPDLLEGWRA